MQLIVSERIDKKLASGEITQAQYDKFAKFVNRLNNEFMTHEVITNNEYCRWYANGDLSVEHVKHFIIQFSVFSNLFLIAQLKKVINADTLEESRESKEILMNELGVIFNSGKTTPNAVADKEREGDPDIVSTEGTVEKGIFKFRAAHFEWLCQMGKHFDLEFNQMGKRKHGTDSTLFFCDELERIYGSPDYNEAQGASFAVENWAADGFWGQLIEGFSKFRKDKMPKLPLAFFTWHDKVEAQHKAHTMHELEETYFDDRFQEEPFVKAGKEMLDGTNAFWVGLNKDRLAIEEVAV